MKLFKLIGLTLLAAVSAWLLVATVQAQGGLTVTPSELTVTAIRNREATVTRTLLFQTTEPITDLQIIPLDLTRLDNQEILPAARIQPAQPTSQLTASQPLTVPVVFDLRGIPSGEFKGDLLVNYQQGSLTIPVTLTIKDGPLWPLVVLFLGVSLGVVVSGYRTQGKPRDEVLVRMGQVRTETQADPELAFSFKSAITGHMFEAESALQAKNWPEAQAAVEQAEAVWLNWRKDRPDWLKQIAYADELLASEDLQAEDSRYLKSVARRIDEALSDAPDLPNGPVELNQRLNTMANQLSQYLELRTNIDRLNRFELTSAERDEVVEFQDQLDTMLPEEADKFTALQAAVAAKQNEFVAAAASEGLLAKSTRSLDAMPANLPLPAPALRPASVSAQAVEGQQVVATAKTRLAWFAWGGYLIAVVLLVGAGFSQLYIVRPTFGDAPWADYFALFLWGFGAEASRAAITDVLRTLDLPGVK